MIVTGSLPARSLPAAAPPSLTKSLSFIAASLPAPTTIRRDALRPSGSRMSSVDPLLPLNWLVAAARLTRLAALPRDLRILHDTREFMLASGFDFGAPPAPSASPRVPEKRQSKSAQV